MAGAQKQGRPRSAPDQEERRLTASAATWHALEELAHDLGTPLHAIVDEAFGDLLRKHRRPRSLREALRESARQYPANDCEPFEA